MSVSSVGGSGQVGAASAAVREQVRDLCDTVEVLCEKEWDEKLDGGPRGQALLNLSLDLLAKCDGLRGHGWDEELDRMAARLGEQFSFFAAIQAHKGGDLTALDAELDRLPPERLALLRRSAFDFLKDAMAAHSIAREPDRVAAYAEIGLEFAETRLMDPSLKVTVNGEAMDLRQWMTHTLGLANEIRK